MDSSEHIQNNITVFIRMKVTIYVPCPGKSCNALLSLERETFGKFGVKIKPIYNNRKGLPELYNECIDQSILGDDDWIIFCHNDIIVESNALILKLMQSEFDVIGVAGASQVKLQEPALWHLMGGGFGSGHLHGAVAHGDMFRKHMTSFGEYPARCIILDGVLMGINKKVYGNLRFDESNPAKFHFYDLDYSLSAHKAGYKVGVSDILITHESPGLRSLEDEQWQAGQKWFLEKHGN